jgi:ribosomal protein L11 methyltransferase
VARRLPALELRFPVLEPGSDLADRVLLALDDLAPAAIHESGTDTQPVWRVFLENPADVDRAGRELLETLAPDAVAVVRIEVDDEDWAARSQAHLTRVTVGAITVAPPWDLPSTPGPHVIVIHPSTGFGTGHHETTRLCLALLQETPLAGRRVLDLGTGSGVLAIAAWRLGAADVEAIDYDEDAIANAMENLRLNIGADAVALRRADLRVDAVGPADVVTANLTGALLIAQAARIASLVRPGGTLILGGILDTELDAVAASFAPPLSLEETRAEGEWRGVRLMVDD